MPPPPRPLGARRRGAGLVEVRPAGRGLRGSVAGLDEGVEEGGGRQGGVVGGVLHQCLPLGELVRGEGLSVEVDERKWSRGG